MLSSKYNSPIACGFGAAVLSTIPELQQLSFFLIVPVGAVFSIYLDQKINKDKNTIEFRKAFTFGLLTGLFAGIFATLFHLIITFFTRTNYFVQTLPEMEMTLNNLSSSPGMKPIADQYIKLFREAVYDIKTTGFSAIYSFIIFLSFTLLNTCFGLIGGLIGRKYLNKKISGNK